MKLNFNSYLIQYIKILFQYVINIKLRYFAFFILCLYNLVCIFHVQHISTQVSTFQVVHSHM